MPKIRALSDQVANQIAAGATARAKDRAARVEWTISPAATGQEAGD